MGLVKALGIQASVALISLGCLFFISLPAACFLAFWADGGIQGLWIGYFLGMLVQVLILAWLTCSSDW